MALVDLNFFSTSLGMQAEVLVIIPQKKNTGEIGTDNTQSKDKLKVLYLLHGLSDDHTIWMRRTSIERYASAYGICVVMPNGHQSFYTDMKFGYKYYTYLTEELPMRINEFFSISAGRENTYIAGLSMGGYGALKAALRNPDKYAAASGLSAVVDIHDFCRRRPDVAYPIFGEALSVPEEDDLFRLAEKHKSNEVKPRIYLGIGRQDGLYGTNQSFRTHISGCGYDLTYRESDGVHNWVFWDEYIQYALEWMMK